MALAHRWANRSLSRLELVSALVALALFTGVFVGRGLRVLAMAEAAMVRTTEANLESALRILFYRLVIESRVEDAVTWVGANPIALIESPGATLDMAALLRSPELARFSAGAAGMSSRYLGEFAQPDPAVLPAGMWYFDSAERHLVYIVRNREFFRSSVPGVPRIRFLTELQFEDRNGDRRYSPGLDPVTGIGLELVEPYEWIGEGIES